MKKFQLLLLACLFMFSGYSQDETIMTISGEKISKSEFEYVFKKNNTNHLITEKELDEYMELFINYKLKVKEAEELGLDTATAFINELEGYRDQLAEPYLTNSKVDEELLEQAYERLKTEVRASHILIRLETGASPDDTLKAYNTILDIRTRLVSGEIDFDAAALKYSQDPSVKNNNGDLGYFTAFQMVYPFENAAYETPVGDVSSIVKTRFGYHILKVVDKRVSRGEVKVAHIVIISNDKMKPKEQEQAKEKIDEIYAKVIDGADFALMAKQFSDDKGSAGKGGELPMFGPGKMVPEFEDEAFSLKNPGDISPPFKSRFGWHIIKLLEVKKLESFEALKPSLEKKVQRDSRSQLSRDAFIQDRKTEYGTKEYSKSLAAFYTWVDSSIYVSRWSVDPTWKMNKTLFTLSKTKYTQKDFADYLLAKMKRPTAKNKTNLPIETFVNESYKSFKDKMVIDYEKAHLEEKYPAFKSLMQEYHDGILLFELSDQKVWKRATSDSIGLDTYYQEHKLENVWDERAESVIYKSLNDDIAHKVHQYVSDSLSSDSILAMVNIESQLNLVIEEGLFMSIENEIFSKVEWKRGLSEIVLLNSQFVFVNISDILLPSPKTLDEAKGLYISAYQENLENDWIISLRANYPVVINKEVLYSIASE